MARAGSPTVLAVGGWLKNAACLTLHGQAHWSTLHGDLDDPAACRALETSVQRLLALADAAGAPVQAVAHDLHPDFFSTRLALATAAARGVPAIAVQHHHAHLAAVVAAQGGGAWVGAALDGVGLGTDGTPWGGELLWLHGPQWRRLGHLQPLALPGGDRAAREPWRMAASALHAIGRADQIVPRLGPQVGADAAAAVRQMLERRLNSPLSSSAGRWFDAAAGLLGLCLRAQHEAQAAVALEQAAGRALQREPGLAASTQATLHADGCIDLRPVLASLLDAPDPDRAAAGFHLALADAWATALVAAARRMNTHRVALGGGCFFNRILRERLLQRLSAAGLSAHLPGPPGCGDAGLALGQAWVAAQQWQERCLSLDVEETPACA